MQQDRDEDYEFESVVRKDLKNEATDDEIKILKANPHQWKLKLVAMKLSTESQMAASKARRFTIHREWVSGDTSDDTYHESMQSELQWKCNANRFLQQLETKIQTVNLYIKEIVWTS